MIEKLVVYPERMQRNLDSLGGLVHSQRVLLALTQAGMSREDAYRIVQRNAMATWREGGSFKDSAARRPDASQASRSRAEVEAMFDLGYHFKRVDAIFRRVFPSTAPKTRRPKTERRPQLCFMTCSLATSSSLSISAPHDAGAEALAALRSADDLLQHVVVARLLEIGHHDGLRVGVEFGAATGPAAGRPIRRAACCAAR